MYTYQSEFWVTTKSDCVFRTDKFIIFHEDPSLEIWPIDPTNFIHRECFACPRY
jgi:hypothetical protein